MCARPREAVVLWNRFCGLRGKVSKRVNDSGTRGVDDRKATLLALGVGAACHELRSPLAVVYGFGRMLESADLDEKSRKYVEAINSAADRLDELLDSFATTGRIAAGRIEPIAEPVSLVELVDAATADERWPDANRVSIQRGQDATVQVDRAWAVGVIVGVCRAMLWEPSLSLAVNWKIARTAVEMTFELPAGTPMAGTDERSASILLALQRMRIEAMGGQLRGGDDRVVVTFPRH